MTAKPKSRRQKLGEAVGSGELRYQLDRTRLDAEVIELLIEIASRYCEPKKRKKVR